MSTNPEGLSQNVKESGRNLRSEMKNGKRIVLQQFESGLHLGYTSTQFRVQRAVDFGKYLHSRGLQPTLVSSQISNAQLSLQIHSAQILLPLIRL